MDFQAIRYTDILLTNYRNYTYSAKLKFLKVNKQLVGKYSCISSNREFGHRGKEEDLKADFYVYVPGEHNSILFKSCAKEMENLNNS